MRGRVVEYKDNDKVVEIPTGTAEGENEKTTTGMLPFVYVGKGNDQKKDYGDKVVKNKIVLAERGGASFNDKAELAASLGAKGIVIFNSKDGSQLSFMSGMENKNFPSVFISYQDGQKLINLQKTNPDQQLSLIHI